jgi:hypothetical protein
MNYYNGCLILEKMKWCDIIIIGGYL